MNAMSGIDSIFHANGVYVDSPGYHPETSGSHVFRPNGADGTHGARHGSDRPSVPRAPLGRGIPVPHDSRVSPFAITAYPVGITNSIVSLIVEMIEPYQGRVDDPAMGSGGFFVQSERFIEERGGSIGDIMVFGQDQWAWGAHLRRAKRARRVRLRRKQPNQSNPTTWRLAAMNMAICGSPRHSATTPGIDFDFGKEPADTFTRDQHPDLRADFVMALPSAAARSLPRGHPADRPNGRINPPFNIKEWWDGKLEGDARWNRSEAELASHAQFYQNRGKYGTPPQTAMRECAPLKPEGTPQVVSEARDKNANFAWVQHMLHHLAPNGSMALLLANGSMSSNSSGEGDIRSHSISHAGLLPKYYLMSGNGKSSRPRDLLAPSQDFHHCTSSINLLN